MMYSSEKPTKPGWYWYKPFRNWTSTKVVQLIKERDGLYQDGWSLKYTNGFWAGPIEEPTGFEDERTVIRDDTGRVIGKQG
jgi:hypothetical protein